METDRSGTWHAQVQFVDGSASACDDTVMTQGVPKKLAVEASVNSAEPVPLRFYESSRRPYGRYVKCVQRIRTRSIAQLFHDPQLDPSVTGAALVGAIIRNGLLFAVSGGNQSRLVDASAREEETNGFGTTL